VDDRRRVLREGFDELAPDLFSLQETIVTDRYDQVRDLLGEESSTLPTSGNARLTGRASWSPAAGLLGRRSLKGMSVCYRDTWDSAHPDDPGHTYIPENGSMGDDWPFRRIDYILVRCGEHGGPTLTIDRCERSFDRPVGGIWASDHYGLAATPTSARRCRATTTR
jgi:hypothetical protein